MPLRPKQIPHGLTWNQIWPPMARSWWQNAWAMV